MKKETGIGRLKRASVESFSLKSMITVLKELRLEACGDDILALMTLTKHVNEKETERKRKTKKQMMLEATVHFREQKTCLLLSVPFCALCHQVPYSPWAMQLLRCTLSVLCL